MVQQTFNVRGRQASQREGLTSGKVRLLLERSGELPGKSGELPRNLWIAPKNLGVSNCRETLASVAAPPPSARQGFGGPNPNYPRHPSQVAVLHPPSLPRAKISATGGSGMGCDRAFLGGRCSCDTPVTHSIRRRNCRRSRDEGVATPWSTTGGGV